MNEYCLRNINESDLKLILSWRNHPDVRRFMLTQNKISWVEHQDWYSRVREDPFIYLFIFEESKVAKGFVKISQNSTVLQTADWGFYLAPDTGSGIGHKLGNAALEYTFNTLKLHKLCGQVLAFNTSSIQFHRRLGFQQEGQLRDQYFDGTDYHDIICFGLIDSEWIVEN